MPVLTNRWVTAVGSVVMMLAAGTPYLFSVWSSDVKSRLGLSNEQTALIGTMGNVGSYTSIFGGVFFDYFGPVPTAALGAAGLFVSYGAMALAMHDTLFSRSYGSIAGWMYVMGQAGGWTYACALNTSVVNFHPRHRGSFVGVLVAFYGLSASWLAQVYQGFFKDDSPGFFVFLMVTLTTMTLGASTVMTRLPPVLVRGDPTRRVLYGTGLAVCCAVYVAGASVARALSDDLPSLGIAVGLIALLCFIFALPARSGRLWWRASADGGVAEAAAITPEEGGGDADGEAYGGGGREEEVCVSLPEAMRAPDIWLLFFTQFCGIGVGLMTLNNIGAIAVSRDGGIAAGESAEKDDVPIIGRVPALTALFTVFNAFGRLVSGACCDALRRRRRARADALVAASLAMCAVQVWLLAATQGMLWVGMPVLGFAYGFFFVVQPLVCIDFFGTRWFGSTWCFVKSSPALGSYLLATLLAGKLSDRRQDDGHWVDIVDGDDTTRYCVGAECFRTCYYVSIAVTLLGTVASVAVARRAAATAAARAAAARGGAATALPPAALPRGKGAAGIDA